MAVGNGNWVGLSLLLTTTFLLRERTTVADTVAYWRAGDVAG